MDDEGRTRHLVNVFNRWGRMCRPSSTDPLYEALWAALRLAELKGFAFVDEWVHFPLRNAELLASREELLAAIECAENNLQQDLDLIAKSLMLLGLEDSVDALSLWQELDEGEAGNFTLGAKSYKTGSCATKSMATLTMLRILQPIVEERISCLTDLSSKLAASCARMR